MRRVYLAVVQGDPPASGVIDAPIGRDPRSRVRMAVLHRGKPARTAFRVLERFGHAALVECRLETGRTHQIRVHLTASGHGLIGDPTYGRPRSLAGLKLAAPAEAALRAFPRQALHAAVLGFVHPITEVPLHFEAPWPGDFAALVNALE
jgi:23S rRNA pseudouridine1911/1915/1917 synthase